MHNSEIITPNPHCTHCNGKGYIGDDMFNPQNECSCMDVEPKECECHGKGYYVTESFNFKSKNKTASVVWCYEHRENLKLGE